MYGFKLLSGIGEATFSENESLSEFYSGLPLSWMNNIFRVDGNLPNLEHVVSEALAKYAGRIPMMWHVGALTTAHERVKEILTGQGLHFEGAEPGMVLEREKLKYSDPLPDFSVRSVEHTDQISDWLNVYAPVFSFTDAVKQHFETFIRSQVGRCDNQGWFTGYASGTPVSTAYYFIDSGVCMIYNVGTDPQFRKKGYARRVVEAAIAHANARCHDPITLYASEMGRALYEDMGFVEVYRFDKYVLAES